MRMLEQARAEHAFEKVPREESEHFQARYRAYVDRLGPAVRLNGLGQALATELAAAGPGPQRPDERAHRLLVDNLQDWLCRAEGIFPGSRDLLASLMQSEQQDYLRAQVEALEWLTWHKKLCRAHLSKGQNR